MRVALTLLDFAMLRTCRAVLAGKLTLWRTVFKFALITPLCTRLVRHLRFLDHLQQRRKRRPRRVGFPLFRAPMRFKRPRSFKTVLQKRPNLVRRRVGIRRRPLLP